MRILIIDGMGGGIGKALIEKINIAALPNIETVAVGTNAIATTAMLKAGATHSATGENAVVFNAAKADIIIGVMGIVFANSMHGEVSPAMAAAVSASGAHKVLIPIDKCNVTTVGVRVAAVQDYINEAIQKLRDYITNV